MPDQTKNQESLFPSFYYSEPTALEKEQSEIPRSILQCQTIGLTLHHKLGTILLW